MVSGSSKAILPVAFASAFISGRMLCTAPGVAAVVAAAVAAVVAAAVAAFVAAVVAAVVAATVAAFVAATVAAVVGAVVAAAAGAVGATAAVVGVVDEPLLQAVRAIVNATTTDKTTYNLAFMCFSPPRGLKRKGLL